MKYINFFLMAGLSASLLTVPQSVVFAGGDQETLAETCKQFQLTKINKRLLAAVSSLGEQQFQTEIHYLADKSAISKVRFTFHDAANNRNFAKCEKTDNKVQITIPFNYGQLPVFMQMWRIARDKKESKKMVCSVVFNEDQALTRGACDLMNR